MVPYFLSVGVLYILEILLIVAGSIISARTYQALPSLVAINYVILAIGYIWLARRASRCHSSRPRLMYAAYRMLGMATILALIAVVGV